jgi:hypothetical protein
MKRKLMNTSCAGRRSGSVLVSALIFALVIAVCLTSYLLLVQNSELRVGRAQRWNSALAIAEAGVEEALCQLNAGGSLSSNGWVQSTNNIYGPLTRAFGGGSYTVKIALSSSGTMATIYSTGTVTAPITQDQISRAVKVQAVNGGAYSVAAGAVTGITGKGNAGFFISSWNSHDTNNIQDSNGSYNGYHGTNGNFALVSGLVDLQNQNIYGDLYLGPGATETNAANGGVQGTTFNNWNGKFPDAVDPTVDTNGNPIFFGPSPTATVTSSGNGNGNGNNKTTTIYDFTTSGYYYVDQNLPIVVEAGVKVTLAVRPNSNPPNWTPGNITINGGMTNAGTLIAFQQNGTVDLQGLGGAISNRPENFTFYGESGVTNITMAGSTTYIGVVYAPDADIKLSGGGSGYNIVGSIVGKSIYLNGHYDIHYDVSLQQYHATGYSPYSWEEL